MAETTRELSLPLIRSVWSKELAEKIIEAVEQSPRFASLFNDLSRSVLETKGPDSNREVFSEEYHHSEHVNKRRKVENGVAANNNDNNHSGGATVAEDGSNNKKKRKLMDTDDMGDADDGELSLTVKDVSFAMPVRKKCALEVTKRNGDGRVIKGRNLGSGEVEFRVDSKDIEHVFRLPVPEKSTKQTNFIIMPKGCSGLPTAAAGAPEPILFTVPSTVPKTAFWGPSLTPLELPDPESDDQPLPTYESVIHAHLESASIPVTTPSDDEFASAIRESHRKNETTYHVKAFRGSKEGYLFFLPNGILFGFKKPLLFFSFPSISSISYTSVLQRTFNLNIAVQMEGRQEDQEFEFSMLEQADFAGIDAYVKRHGLNDASMAASRRAKVYDVNGKTDRGENGDGATGGVPGGEGGGGEEESELQRAKREMEDREDEQEEDYDPSDEGDSDGSGSESGEDGDGGYEEGDYDDDDDDGEGRDLVKEELGSEAEEVEITDEEEEEEEEI